MIGGPQQPGNIRGANPLIYQGSTPNMIIMQRRPTSTDVAQYELGYWWVIPKNNQGAIPSNEVWILVSKQNNIATWKQLTGGSGPSGIALINYQYFTTPGTFTYTPTQGMVQLLVECIGGGGGCQAVNNNIVAGYAASGGGGGGGYAKKIFLASDIGSHVSINVGAPGAGGSVPGVPAGTGGDSSFGSFITAHGGDGAGTPGGVYGGLGVGGDLNIQGGSGGGALIYTYSGSSFIAIAVGGGGTGGGYGIGGIGTQGSPSFTDAGQGGQGYGAGAGALIWPQTGGVVPGIAGNGGAVIITEYLS